MAPASHQRNGRDALKKIYDCTVGSRVIVSPLAQQKRRLNTGKEDIVDIDTHLHPLVLGIPWLHHHNLHIDWLTGRVLGWGKPHRKEAKPLTATLVPFL